MAISIRLVPKSLSYYLERWDSFWYLRVVKYGYPTNIYEPIPGYPHNEIAFFPGYPMSVRAVSWAFAGHDVLAAYVVNLILGFVLLVVMRLLFARFTQEKTADRAVLLFVFFPATAILSLPYAEPLALTAAACCLLLISTHKALAVRAGISDPLAMQDESTSHVRSLGDLITSHRWFLGGVAGAVATATRPNMLPIVLASLAAALLAIWQRRDWAALAAPVLASSGILTFFAYLGWHTGDFLAWLHNEQVLWQAGRDYGLNMPVDIFRGIAAFDYDTTPNALLKLGGAFFATVGLVMILKLRLPLPVVIFCIGVLAMALLDSSDIGTRPRYVAAAFPLFLGVSALLSPRAWHLVIAASSLVLFATAGIYMGGTTVP